MFQFFAHASINVWNGMCAGNLIFCLRFLPLLAHLAILAYAAASVLSVLLILRRAAQLAWPGLGPRTQCPTVWQRLGPTSRLTVTMIGLWSNTKTNMVVVLYGVRSMYGTDRTNHDGWGWG